MVLIVTLPLWYSTPGMLTLSPPPPLVGLPSPLQMPAGPPQLPGMEEMGVGASRAKRYSSQRQRPVPEPGPPLHLMEGHYYEPSKSPSTTQRPSDHAPLTRPAGGPGSPAPGRPGSPAPGRPGSPALLVDRVAPPLVDRVAPPCW